MGQNNEVTVVENIQNEDLEDLKLIEDDDVMIFQWISEKDKFDLIYKKEKDLVMILKNEKMVKLDRLSEVETRRYKEALEIAINYHHERIAQDIQ